MTPLLSSSRSLWQSSRSAFSRLRRKLTDPRKRAVYSATPCMKWKRTLRLRAQERLHAKRSKSVNAATGKPHTCVFGHVVFETFEEVKDITISEHQFTIVKRAIIAVHTPMGFMPIAMTQFMVVA